MLISLTGEIRSNTIIVGDFNIPLTQTLNDTIDQLDLTDIYRTLHPKIINFTFFSRAHGTFSRIDHILSHKFSLGKFKKTEIPSIFSDHKAVRLNVNYRKKKTKKQTKKKQKNKNLLKIQTYGG